MIDRIGSLSPLSPSGPLGPAGSGGPGALDAVLRSSAAAPAGPASASAPASGSDPSTGGSFLDALGEAVARLNDQLVAADGAAADFAAGGSTDLHDVILSLTEAGLGLRLGVAVRDRLLEAYQDVMRLQI